MSACLGNPETGPGLKESQAEMAKGLGFEGAWEAAELGMRAGDLRAFLGTETTARSHSGGQGSPQHGPFLLVIAANELACRGLDHLEEKIPALQYPPEKVSPFLFPSDPYTAVTASQIGEPGVFPSIHGKRSPRLVAPCT